MKKSGWKTILQVIVSVLTAAITALGTTSCMALKREAIQIITKGCPQGHPFVHLFAILLPRSNHTRE